ncbi:rho guanine nucleotide exchange factor 10-like isoform X9 [Anneissia japonica]|uniref:rho guanine nucleotide exchange factor 10-like isoform X3 n=1 Tax=Anneissia japonica TaxID=1529436 RepID=UPI0014258A00|nr:rho guanine nucleotide exchange factor 10-like isoform X3 [Anneissia japonica]XP_033107627.1 rho guanine nucleotide exchange factor 10-like isoform X9 [Anneissia japonica]
MDGEVNTGDSVYAIPETVWKKNRELKELEPNLHRNGINQSDKNGEAETDENDEALYLVIEDGTNSLPIKEHRAASPPAYQQLQRPTSLTTAPQDHNLIDLDGDYIDPNDYFKQDIMAARREESGAGNCNKNNNTAANIDQMCNMHVPQTHVDESQTSLINQMDAGMEPETGFHNRPHSVTSLIRHMEKQQLFHSENDTGRSRSPVLNQGLQRTGTAQFPKSKSSPESSIKWCENEHYVGGYGYGYIPSNSSILADRFDALKGDDDDGDMYDDVDEGAHGIFIDDDWLYESLMLQDEDEVPMVDESDSSWSSEEWDHFSDDSDDNDMVHSHVEQPDPASTKESNGSQVHRRTSMRAVYGVDKGRETREETKQSPLVEWVKSKRSLDKVRSLFFGGRSTYASKAQTKEEDLEEDPEEIHIYDVKLCQAKHPPPTLPPQPEGLTQGQVVRRHILQSIMDSEKSYMMSLQRLIQSYEKPLLEREPPLLEKEKIKTIFYRIRGIYQCHLMFQIALSSRVKHWDEIGEIGDVFVASFSKAMVLDVYSAYVNNFTNAMDTAKKAAALKPAFNEFILEQQKSSKDRLSLYGLMLKPIQRFPQFILLLQDMLKNTPVGHTDRMPLQLALTKLETLAGVLNERKRQCEQRHEVKQLIKNLNVKFKTKSSNDKQRWLVRQDDMLQTTYNSQGSVLKCRERRLFMFNDLLVCTTVLNKSTTGMPNQDIPKYKHKWSVPLQDVEIVEPTMEGGDIELNTEPGRMTVTTSQMDEHEYLIGGSTRQLYQERNNIMHDLAVVNQITALIGTLKGSYGIFNTSDITDLTGVIQKMIEKKGKEIKQADINKIQLSLPAVEILEDLDCESAAKYQRGNKRVTIVFDAISAKIKFDWVTALENAKLGLKRDNNPGWHISEDDEIHAEMGFGIPLLSNHLPVFTTATHQTIKVLCSVLCPVESSRLRRTKAMESNAAKHCLWICSTNGQKLFMSLIGFQPPSPQVIETFELMDIENVSCMENVPGYRQDRLSNKLDYQSFRFSWMTVWVGDDKGRIFIFNTVGVDKSKSISSLKVPSPVTSLMYLHNQVFVAQDNGCVLVYSRNPGDGAWKVKEPKIIELGHHPVTSLLSVGKTLWCGCGNRVHLIDVANEFKQHVKNGLVKTQSSFEVHQDESTGVQSMVMAGVGVWIALKELDTIRLFHMETLQLLQDISVSSPVRRMLQTAGEYQAHFPSGQPITVTHMLACYGSLWVGTNIGVIANFPLPRLEGVPLVTGPAMVSFHMQNGPIRFLHGMEINQQSDDIHFTSKDDVEEPSNRRTPASTPHGEKCNQKYADLVNNAMSPMQDYLSLTFADADMMSSPPTDRKSDSAIADSSDISLSSKDNLETNEEQVSARVTSTTTLVLTGGDGHTYLQPNSSQSSGEAGLLIWQVSM